MLVAQKAPVAGPAPLYDPAPVWAPFLAPFTNPVSDFVGQVNYFDPPVHHTPPPIYKEASEVIMWDPSDFVRPQDEDIEMLDFNEYDEAHEVRYAYEVDMQDRTVRDMDGDVVMDNDEFRGPNSQLQYPAMHDQRPFFPTYIPEVRQAPPQSIPIFFRPPPIELHPLPAVVPPAVWIYQPPPPVEIPQLPMAPTPAVWVYQPSPPMDPPALEIQASVPSMPLYQDSAPEVQYLPPVTHSLQQPATIPAEFLPHDEGIYQPLPPVNHPVHPIQDSIPDPPVNRYQNVAPILPVLPPVTSYHVAPLPAGTAQYMARKEEEFTNSVPTANNADEAIAQLAAADAVRLTRAQVIDLAEEERLRKLNLAKRAKTQAARRARF